MFLNLKRVPVNLESFAVKQFRNVWENRSQANSKTNSRPSLLDRSIDKLLLEAKEPRNALLYC